MILGDTGQGKDAELKERPSQWWQGDAGQGKDEHRQHAQCRYQRRHGGSFVVLQGWSVAVAEEGIRFAHDWRINVCHDEGHTPCTRYPVVV